MAILIDKQTVHNYIVRIIKHKTEIFGGFYETELVFNNRVVSSKNGLNLEASYEVFKNTINAVLTHQLYKNITL